MIHCYVHKYIDWSITCVPLTVASNDDNDFRNEKLITNKFNIYKYQLQCLWNTIGSLWQEIIVNNVHHMHYNFKWWMVDIVRELIIHYFTNVTDDSTIILIQFLIV